VIELRAGSAVCTIDPDGGGHIVSLAVDGFDLLLTPDDEPGSTHWGAFVMAPWAGRTRRGRFVFDGVEHDLPVNAPPHAIHGTVRDRAWTVNAHDERHASLRCDFGPSWPFVGWVEHDITIHPDHVDLQLALHASTQPMPAACGWHPWWRRNLGDVDARLDLPASSMYRRDDDGPDGMTTTDVITPPPPGPWDDCFTGLTGPPMLHWDGALSLAIESDCPCVVVFDQLAPAVCVEPQSAPPDALNHEPAIASPDHPVVAHTTWRWTRPPSA
jgi:galactose mutarotase-like enzyme